MSSKINDFFSKIVPSVDNQRKKSEMQKFCDEHLNSGRKIVLVTSGGTTVPLERNTVRYLDNFSMGTRGSASTEYFLTKGYNVIFLYRQNSLAPFTRHFSNLGFLDLLNLTETSGKTLVEVRQDKISSLVPVLRRYHEAKNGRLLFIDYTSLTDYLWLLREACDALRAYDSRAMFYLAAAVSDFYIPEDSLPVHKLQSDEGAPTISLQLVPKVLEPLVSQWVPRAFVVSFKLETDSSILVSKARKALKKYGHKLVIGNLLHTRKYHVVFVTESLEYDVILTEEERSSGSVEIEERIVSDLTKKHDEFIISQPTS